MNRQEFEAFDACGNSYKLISFSIEDASSESPFEQIGNIHTSDGHNVQYLEPRKYRILNFDDEVSIYVTSDAPNAP